MWADRVAAERRSPRSPDRAAGARSARSASAMTSGPMQSPGRQDDLHAGAAAARPGRSRRRRGVIDAHDVGVLRLDVEEVRLVRRLRPVAHAVARHDRRPAVLEQVDRRRANAARGRGAAEDDRVDALGDQDRRRGSCRRSPRRPSSGRWARRRAGRGAGRCRPSGRRARAPRGSGPSRAQSPPSFSAARSRSSCRRPGWPLSRAASSSRRVASICGVRSAPSGHSASVKPQLKSIDEHRGPLAERERLAEPGPLVDLACLLRRSCPPSCLRRRSRRAPRRSARAGRTGRRPAGRRARRPRRSSGRVRARPPGRR